MLKESQLRLWQQLAKAELVKNPYHLLGAAPGAGKTITLLSAYAAVPGRTLLVCPQIIADTVWEAESLRWEHTSKFKYDYAHRYSGSDRESAWFNGKGDFVTCTPDTLPKFVNAVNARKTVPVTRVCVDEAHLFKNALAVRTKALLALAEIIPVHLSSGTISPNGVLDCWVPGFITTRGGAFWK